MIIDDIFLLPADWSKEVSLIRSWRTNIQTTVLGGEKRSSVLSYPKKKLKHLITNLSYNKSAYLKRKLYKNMHKIFGIPFWMDRTILESQAIAGTYELDVEALDYRNFEVGAPCLIFNSHDDYEYAEITGLGDSSGAGSSASAGEISLKTSLGNTWPSGTSIYPMMQGRLNSTQSFSWMSASFNEISIEFDEAFDVDVIKSYSGDVSERPVYNSIPVFDSMPNWIQRPTGSAIHPIYLEGFLGKQASYNLWKETTFSIGVLFSMYSKLELYEFLQFFDYMQGRLNPFYCPTWTRDVNVISPIEITDTTIQVSDIKYPDYWDLGLKDQFAKNIVLNFPDGTQVYREILSAVDDSSAGTETFTLDQQVGKACSALELPNLLVSFLPRSRFADDEVIVDFITEEHSKIRTKIRSIPSDTEDSS